MRLPHFVVIGAAKAGTTSLYAILNRHERIFMPKIKEPEFFARDDLYDAPGGLEAYAATYDGASDDQLIGEASTLYTLSPLFPKTPERLAAHVPQAKLVYIMRQPVDRAYSFYVQVLKNYQNITGDPVIHRSFEEFIDPEARNGAAPRDKVFSPVNAHLPDVPELCLAGSEYVMQIQAYLQHFSRDQMLFLTFEDFIADRVATTRKITDFLGLEPLADAIFDEAGVTRNIAADHFAEWGERVAVDEMRAKAGAAWELRKIVPKGMRKALKGKVAKPKDTTHMPAKMRPETRAALNERFSAQIPQLQEMTGLDLSVWKM